MLTAPKTWMSALTRWVAGGPRPACPICGSGRPVVFDDTRPRTMLICRSCRHLYWDRTPTPDELCRHYSEQYSEQHGQDALQRGIRDYYRTHASELARLLGKPPADLCLVDYGSSIPVLVEEAVAVGYSRAVAVDYDKASFAYARERGLEIVAPPEYEQFPDGSVDVIRFSHVLEHMPDPVAAVATAVAKLRPGGLLYITQPSFPHYRPVTTRYRLRDSVYPTHLHYFTPLSLKRMLERFPVRAHQFYTHTDPDETMRETAEALDLDLTRAEMADWAGRGQDARGELCNYPYYAGANSELWAFKVTQGASQMKPVLPALKTLVPVRVRRWLRAGDHVARIDAERTADRDEVHRLRDALAALQGRLAESLDRIAGLDTAIATLGTQLGRQQRIDTVRVGTLKLFMYTDDAAYKHLHANEKHYQLSARDFPPPPHGEEPGAGQPPRPRSHDNLTTVLLAHYWDNGMDPWVIDVGASYGFEVIYTALRIRDAGRSGVVVGFEPGVAGTLLPQNVALNGVAERVRVEQAAVGAYSGFALMFGEDGHSENNRIVNRWYDVEAFSRVVPVVALDDYVERNGVASDLIVKVDTQGGEPEVLDGMATLMRERATTLIIEFSPSSVRNRVAPEDLLVRLARHGTIVDLNQRGPLAPVAAGFPVVESDRFAAFAAEVLARPYEWSDLLVVPFNLPNRDALLARLESRPTAHGEAA